MTLLWRCPVRILHAEVDEVATIDNSEQLVKDAKEAGKTNIELVRQVNSAWSSDANLTQSLKN
jgi:dipeptidyl aminopeptidase/acylaminoacyl peptidase